MSAKKFPTPNLDKLVCRNHMDYGPLTAAAQADIALAVEAARATVPDDVREQLGFYVDVIGEYIAREMEPEFQPTARQRLGVIEKWLESLTVAPKDSTGTQVYGPITIKEGDHVEVVVTKPFTVTKDTAITFTAGKVEAPTDKLCGTCAYFTEHEPGHPLGTCSPPVPWWCGENSVRASSVKPCPCWKANP